ncbi:MAG: hypothetical protein ABW195_16240 [Ilumatobacteraceae bacterium]
MPTFPPHGLIAEFCDQLVAHDLPDLPTDRRAEVVAFTIRRIDGLPSPMRLGVGLVATSVGGLGTVLGLHRVVGVLATRPLPLLGEYVRLVRSLVYAYVWETWPDTTTAGAARATA